jgi:hypothetical protein
MRYGELLTRSFRISWRHRYLWLLALFAGEGGGGGGNFGGNPGGASGATSGGNRGGTSGAAPPTPAEVQAAVASWIADHLGLIVLVGVVVLVIILVLVGISCVAQPALVRASAEHDAERPYSLGPAFRFGLTAFWRILGLKLLALIFALVVLAIFGGLVLWGVTSAAAGNHGGVGAAITIGILLALLLIPITIVLSVVYIFAVRAITLDGRGPISGISHGVRLIFRRLGRVALVWLIMLGISLGIGIGLFIVFLVLLIPLGLLVFAAYVAGHGVGLVVAGTVAVIVLIVVSLVVAGAVGAFTSTYWTLAYRRLDLEPLQPASA